MAEVWEVMWAALPPGFRFHPTDEEFVLHYLMNYIHGIKENFNIIPFIDDLFKRDPRELPLVFKGLSIVRSKDPEWWFLSTLKYKSVNSDKFDRSTSWGSWKITGKPKEICDRGGNRPIAMKRNLVFCENQRNDEINWIFHEYHLHDVSLGLTLNEQRKYVLCHLVNRQYDYAEVIANMEVDLEHEDQQHGFSEEIIQAKVRSLMEGLSPPASDSSVHNPWRTETIFTMRVEDAGDYLADMEMEISTNGGDEDILDLLNQVAFSTDGESAHSGEFEVASDYEPLFIEETPREAILKENRRCRPPETLQGYVVVDETRQSVEEDSQRTEAGGALGLQDCPKDARPNHSTSLHKPTASHPRRTETQIVHFKGSNHRSPAVTREQLVVSPGRYHDTKGTKADEPKTSSRQNAVTKALPMPLAVRRSPSIRLQTSQTQQGNEKMLTTSGAKEGCRAPIDYLVNLGVGTVLLVMFLRWLLFH